MPEIRISLNYKDLEKLLGGGEDAAVSVGLELRRFIAAEFAKREFPKLAKDLGITEAIAEARELCMKEARVALMAFIEKDSSSWYSNITEKLTDKAKVMIRKEVDSHIYHIVSEAVKGAVEKRDNEWKNDIERLIKQRIDAEWRGTIDAEVNKRLKEVASLIG